MIFLCNAFSHLVSARCFPSLTILLACASSTPAQISSCIRYCSSLPLALVILVPGRNPLPRTFAHFTSTLTKAFPNLYPHFTSCVYAPGCQMNPSLDSLIPCTAEQSYVLDIMKSSVRLLIRRFKMLPYRAIFARSC